MVRLYREEKVSTPQRFDWNHLEQVVEIILASFQPRNGSIGICLLLRQVTFQKSFQPRKQFDWNVRKTPSGTCPEARFNPATVRLECKSIAYCIIEQVSTPQRFDWNLAKDAKYTRSEVSTPQRFDWNGMSGCEDYTITSFNPQRFDWNSDTAKHRKAEFRFNPATVRLECGKVEHVKGLSSFQPRNGSIGISISM